MVLKWKKIKGELSKTDNLNNTGAIFWMSLELGLNLIAPLPYMNEFEFSTTYPDFEDTVDSNLNEYLLLFQVSRIFMLSRLLLIFSPFMNSRA